MFRKTLLLVFAVAAVASTGCGGIRGPEWLAVEGEVRLNGQPLPAGVILFQPQDSTALRSMTAGIQSGRFVLPEAEGLLEGAYRVEIRQGANLGFPLDDDVAFSQRGGKPMPREPLPAKYNRNSELIATVSREAENRFVFDLSAPRPRTVTSR